MPPVNVLIKPASSACNMACSCFAFQGGDPTLAGLDFFQETVRFQKSTAGPLWRNGCRRDRALSPEGIPGKTCFCEAHRFFFARRKNQLLDARRILLNLRQECQSQ